MSKFFILLFMLPMMVFSLYNEDELSDKEVQSRYYECKLTFEEALSVSEMELRNHSYSLKTQNKQTYVMLYESAY